jgi:hypothetical protein
MLSIKVVSGQVSPIDMPEVGMTRAAKLTGSDGQMNNDQRNTGSGVICVRHHEIDGATSFPFPKLLHLPK